MEIITGYFISKEPALEAAEHLRNCGFKGKLSIIGQQNEEDNQETDNTRSNQDGVTGISNYVVPGVFAGSFGADTSMMGGGVPLFLAGPIFGMTGGIFDSERTGTLDQWGVPKEVEEEIKSVVKAGNTVILVNCEESEKQFIRDALQNKGAQNIHI